MAQPGVLFRDDKSFYEWLTDSNYGKSVEQRAAIVSKKKVSGRRRRGSSVRDAEEENPNTEAEQRLRQLLQISNRRYCRWVNDRLLRELAPPLDAEEIGGLFSPPPWGERDVLTPLERITGAGNNCLSDMAAWEPFRNNVDMDKEEHMLKSLVKERPKKDESNVTGSMAAMKAWHTVDRRARDALRRNSHLPLVEAFEERILVYVKSADAGEVLTLEVQDPFHRLVLHGICEFYGLVSNTVSKWEDTAGGFSLVTRTHIRKKKHPKSSDSVQPVRLVDFLSAMKNGVPNSEAAA
jgi:hypothetical protein